MQALGDTAEQDANAQTYDTIGNTTAHEHATEIVLTSHCRYTSPSHSHLSAEVLMQRDTVHSEFIPNHARVKHLVEFA